MTAGADIAIHFEPTPKGPFKTIELVRANGRLAASTSYVDAHGMPRSVAELSKHTLIASTHAGESTKHWPLLDGGSFHIEPAIVSNDLSQVARCVLDGHGIALLPDALSHRFADRLTGVLTREVGCPRVASVTTFEALMDTPKVKEVIAHTVEGARRLTKMLAGFASDGPGE